MARDYTEIEVRRKTERRVDKTEDQETAQINAEERASQAAAGIEKRSNDAEKDKTYLKSIKK